MASLVNPFRNLGKSSINPTQTHRSEECKEALLLTLWGPHCTNNKTRQVQCGEHQTKPYTTMLHEFRHKIKTKN